MFLFERIDGTESFLYPFESFGVEVDAFALVAHLLGNVLDVDIVGAEAFGYL